MKEVIEKAKTPPPPFFRRLRNIGVALASISAAILTAPVSLPATAPGYAAVAGGVLGAVSQLVKKEEVE